MKPRLRRPVAIAVLVVGTACLASAIALDSAGYDELALVLNVAASQAALLGVLFVVSQSWRRP